MASDGRRNAGAPGRARGSIPRQKVREGRRPLSQFLTSPAAGSSRRRAVVPRRGRRRRTRPMRGRRRIPMRRRRRARRTVTVRRRRRRPAVRRRRGRSRPITGKPEVAVLARRVAAAAVNPSAAVPAAETVVAADPVALHGVAHTYENVCQERVGAVGKGGKRRCGKKGGGGRADQKAAASRKGGRHNGSPSVAGPNKPSRRLKAIVICPNVKGRKALPLKNKRFCAFVAGRNGGFDSDNGSPGANNRRMPKPRLCVCKVGVGSLFAQRRFSADGAVNADRGRRGHGRDRPGRLCRGLCRDRAHASGRDLCPGRVREPGAAAVRRP